MEVKSEEREKRREKNLNENDAHCGETITPLDLWHALKQPQIYLIAYLEGQDMFLLDFLRVGFVIFRSNAEGTNLNI